MKVATKALITVVFKEKIGDDVFVFDIMAVDEQKLFQGTKIGCVIVNTKNGNVHYHGLTAQLPDPVKLTEDCHKVAMDLKESML